MKKYIVISFLLLFSGCVQLRWITIENGHVVDINGKPVKIVGNPQMVCFDTRNNIIAEGIFVYQNDDGSFLIDQYGKGYITVKNPHCRLGPNE